MHQGGARVDGVQGWGRALKPVHKYTFRQIALNGRKQDGVHVKTTSIGREKSSQMAEISTNQSVP